MSAGEFVAEVERILSEDTGYLRENPVLLLGSGRTLDDLPPPPSKQALWNRAHRDHHQGFLTFGRDWAGPIMYWACTDCGVPEPDCVDQKGDWLSPTDRANSGGTDG